MKQKSDKRQKGGSWRDFGVVLRRSNLPWLWIIIAFTGYWLYNYILLEMPNTTASLMSGNLESKALWDAIRFYIIYGIILCIWTVLEAQACTLSVRRARERLWDKMMRVKVSFYDQNDPSVLMSAVTTDLGTGLNDMVRIMIGILPTLYYVVGALVRIGSFHWVLVLAIVAILPFKYVYALVVGRYSYRFNAKAYAEIGSMTGYLAERIRNLPLIKTYTNEKQELQTGRVAAERLRKANMRVAILGCVIQGIETLLQLSGEIIAMIVAVLLLQRGIIDISQWVAFFLFNTTLSTYFTSMIYEWFQIKQTHGAIVRAAHIYDAPEEDADAPGTASMPEAGLDLEFDNVSLSYGDKPALKGVSFTIPQGTTAAIVGLCGSGKTTSLSLLERFYHADSGEVRFGGVPVEQFNLGEYRRHFAYVQQRPEVFSGTVREAVTYGIDRQIPDDEILEAARRSGFMAYLEVQPKGLDTPVASAGTSMSGGQLQRLVLAREFLRSAAVLMLDEPTSALDTESALAVQDTILTMFAGKTVVMVTHDLRLVQRVDKIIVLQEGELMGSGSYDQLMAGCPLFREMVEAQAREEAAQEW